MTQSTQRALSKYLESTQKAPSEHLKSTLRAREQSDFVIVLESIILCLVIKDKDK